MPLPDVLHALEGRGPLFAVLDAARSPEVLTLVHLHGAPSRPLYQGDLAPHLVALTGQGELLAKLVERGWGKAWGIYLSSPATIDELRKHLRTLLLVRRQLDQSELYFRFYDPRVLRVLLPTFDEQQLALLFGPATDLLLEPEKGNGVLRFTH